MDEILRQRYNQVSYGSPAYAFTHPSHLAALARLGGLRTPALKGARVLELGCGRGGNLIPMALLHPHAQFLGIDLADVEIEQGREIVKTLNLQNIDLRAVSILDVDRSYGMFDYIIAHGVWSWVPHEVQDKILAICDQNLSPSGVAYISFNVLPGCGSATLLRELILLHAAGASDRAGQLAAAREVHDALGACLAGNQSPLAALMKLELARMQKTRGSTLLHDLLAPANQPVYFHHFMEQAGSHGLQFVGDALGRVTALEQFPLDVRHKVRTIARGIIEQEQWADALTGQSFRRSILCHQGVSLGRQNGWRAARELYVGSASTPEASPATDATPGKTFFTVPDGQSVGTTDPFAQSLLLRLGQAWPGSVSVHSVIAEWSAQASEEKVCSTLAAMVPFGLVEFDTDPPPCITTASERPLASALARLQAGRGESVTSLRHEHADIGLFRRLVLARLDGARTREQLLRELSSQLQPIGDSPGSVDPGADPNAALKIALDEALGGLARFGLFLS